MDLCAWRRTLPFFVAAGFAAACGVPAGDEEVPQPGPDTTEPPDGGVEPEPVDVDAGGEDLEVPSPAPGDGDEAGDEGGDEDADAPGEVGQGSDGEIAGPDAESPDAVGADGGEGDAQPDAVEPDGGEGDAQPDAVEPEAPIACGSDKDCQTAGLLCDPLDLVCVGCLFDHDCAEGEQCVAETCAAVPPCLGDGDCAPGHECTSGACLPFDPCKSSKDCEAQVCDKIAGKCVDCLDDADCEDGQHCAADACVAFTICASDKDCADLGQLCDKGQGECVQCLAHEDCPDVYHCAGGACVLDLCTAGEGSCDGNAITLCNEVGDGFDAPAPCGDGTTCLGEGLVAACQPWVCEPAAVTCEGNVLTTCAPDGLSIASENDCQKSGALCKEAACHPIVCPPGDVSCTEDGFGLVTCSADGTSDEAAPCPAAHFCHDGAPATCAPQTCEPDTAFCVGNGTATCDAIGKGPKGAPKDCGILKCVGGACKALVCAPGTTSCADAKTIAACSEDGTSSALESCPDGHHCDDSGDEAGCAPDECEPGEPLCSGDVATTCAEDGSGPLAGGELCDRGHCKDGACVDQVCEPGSAWCDDGDLAICAEDGLAIDISPCPEGTYCDDGAEATCSPQVCEPGEPLCVGAVATVCNDEGSGVVTGEDCAASGASCAGGACVSEEVCGDGFPTSGEACDDGNDDLCDGCEDCHHRRALQVPAGKGTETPLPYGGQGPKTLEAWIRIDTFAAGKLLVAWGNGILGWRITTFTNPGEILAYVSISSQLPQEFSVTTGGLAAGTWHHVAMVVTSAELRFYIDGKLAGTAKNASTTGKTVPEEIDPVVRLGTGPLGFTIDELRISNVERYTKNFVPARRFEAGGGLVALWHLDGDDEGLSPDSALGDHDLPIPAGTPFVSDECYGADPGSLECGDGEVSKFEVCDDGNTEPDDLCSEDCLEVTAPPSPLCEDPAFDHSFADSFDGGELEPWWDDACTGKTPYYTVGSGAVTFSDVPITPGWSGASALSYATLDLGAQICTPMPIGKGDFSLTFEVGWEQVFDNMMHAGVALTDATHHLQVLGMVFDSWIGNNHGHLATWAWPKGNEVANVDFGAPGFGSKNLEFLVYEGPATFTIERTGGKVNAWVTKTSPAVKYQLLNDIVSDADIQYLALFGFHIKTANGDWVFPTIEFHDVQVCY